MRIIATTAVFFLVGVNAIFENEAQDLVSTPKPLNIPYNSTLGCGACIRSGNVFCLNSYYDYYDPSHIADDVCCDSAGCVLNAIEKNPYMKCGTTNSSFNPAPNSLFYNDTAVMLNNLCQKR